MSGELRANLPPGTGWTVFGVLLDSNSKRGNNTDEDFETIIEANYAQYKITVTDDGTGLFVGNMPSWVDAGLYVCVFYRDEGGFGADVRVDDQDVNWNGTGIVDDPEVGSFLVTLATAKEFLQIDEDTEDDIIEALIARVSKSVQKYIARDLINQEYTEYYDGNGLGLLVLNNYPITELSRVNIDPAREFSEDNDVDLTASPAELIKKNDAGLLRLLNGGRFIKGEANVLVVYQAGYESIPQDVQHAVLIYLLYVYKRIYSEQRIGIASETIGPDRTVTYQDKDIPDQAKSLLKQYRKIATPSYVF